MNPQREKTLLDRLDNPETATGKLGNRYDEKIEGNVKKATVGFCTLIVSAISFGLSIWLKGNVWWIALSLFACCASWAMWRNHLFIAGQWAKMAQDSKWWSMATKIDDSQRRR